MVEIADDGTGETHGTGGLVRFDAFGAAVVALAGPAAEHRHFGKPYAWDASEAEWLVDDDGSDDAAVARLVLDHGVAVGFALRQVEMIFEDHWATVQRVAAALLAAPGHRLTGAEVAALTEGMAE